MVAGTGRSGEQNWRVFHLDRALKSSVNLRAWPSPCANAPRTGTFRTRGAQARSATACKTCRGGRRSAGSAGAARGEGGAAAVRRRAAAAARAPASASPNSRARPHSRPPLPVTCSDAPRNSLGMRRPAAPRASPPRSLSSRALHRPKGKVGRGQRKVEAAAPCLCFFHLHSLGAHGHAPLLSLAELMTPGLVQAHTVRAGVFRAARHTLRAACMHCGTPFATRALAHLQTHSRAPTHCAGAARVRWLLHQTPCVLFFFVGKAPRRLSFIGRKGGGW